MLVSGRFNVSEEILTELFVFVGKRSGSRIDLINGFSMEWLYSTHEFWIGFRRCLYVID